MSHFTVMVIGDDAPAQLAPFQENNMGDCPKEYLRFKTYPKDDGDAQWFDSQQEAEKTLGDNFDPEGGYHENPNRKWDWYVLGGRWSDMLRLKNGKRVNSALKSEIDFEGMRELAATEARIRYRNVHEVIDGRVIPNWQEIVERHGTNCDAARKEYNSYKVIHDTRELLGFREDPEEFNCTEDEYAERISKEAYQTHAILKDGVWSEKGRMLMFAAVADEKEPLAWGDEFESILDSVADDTLISIYDCHI